MTSPSSNPSSNPSSSRSSGRSSNPSGPAAHHIPGAGGPPDATALAAMIRRGDLSCSELVQECIQRIERLNPTLNAVVTPRFDEALDEARRLDDQRVRARSASVSSRLDSRTKREADDSRGPDGSLGPGGPFFGLPFLVKDLNHLAGAPTTSGSRYFIRHDVSHDDEIVHRLRRAGLIPVGKSNTPELGLLPTTEPTLFGPTRNPWDPTCTPGGSSGGAAAAVAAGLVPVAHANDGGGSIRIPASCCGLFGLKPTRGRTPTEPVLGYTVNHVLTRSVRDAAGLLDAVAETSQEGRPPRPERPFVHSALTRPLRIGFSDVAPTGAALHPECVQGVHQAAELCAELGHVVEEAQPDIDSEGVTAAFMQVWAASCSAAIDARAEELGRPPHDAELEPLTWTLYRKGSSVGASQLLRALKLLQAAVGRIARFFERYHVWLTPTLASPPVPLGTFHPANPDAQGRLEHIFDMTNAWVPFTPLANVTGRPAMTVPLHWSEAGLPIGMHFLGRLGDEGSLLGLAYALETARPWSHRLPPLCA